MSEKDWKLQEYKETVTDIIQQTTVDSAFNRAADILKREQASIELTPKQADELSVVSSFIFHGILGVPPVCDPAKCAFALECPIATASKGKRCPLEVQLMRSSLEQWMTSLNFLNPKNGLHMSYLNQLVSLDIQEFRLRMRLASPDRSGLTEQVVTAISDDGTPFYETKIVPELAYVNRVSGDRIKLLRELVATPRETYKKVAALKEKDNIEKTRKLGNIKNKIQQINTGDVE